jgi:hypothetical protein
MACIMAWHHDNGCHGGAVRSGQWRAGKEVIV